MGKLSDGRGNLIRQIEQFRKLGIQPSKRLSDDLTRKALRDDDAAFENDSDDDSDETDTQDYDSNSNDNPERLSGGQ